MFQYRKFIGYGHVDSSTTTVYKFEYTPSINYPGILAMLQSSCFIRIFMTKLHAYTDGQA